MVSLMIAVAAVAYAVHVTHEANARGAVPSNSASDPSVKTASSGTGQPQPIAKALAPVEHWYVIDPKADIGGCAPLATYARYGHIPTSANPTPSEFVHKALSLGVPLVDFNDGATVAAVSDQAGDTVGFFKGHEHCLSWAFHQMTGRTLHWRH